MDYNEAKKGIEDTEKVQKARRDFDELKKDEEKYFIDREERFLKRIDGLSRRANECEKDFDNIDSLFAKRISDFKNIFEKFEKQIDFVSDQASSLINKADTLRDKYERFITEIETKMGLIDEAIIKNSEWEKNLKIKEEMVDKKLSEAGRKLAKAERLAYWHKEPRAKYEKE